MIKKALVDGYKEIAYTDKYIYGFYDKKLFTLLFQMTVHWTPLQSSIRQVIRQVIAYDLHQTNSRKKF